MKSTVALPLLAAAICHAHAATQPVSLAVETLEKTGTVDEHFQSYNVEMLEVTGGKFWKPYADKSKDESTSVPTGMDTSRYAYREPLDLTNERLRTLASALAPAYIRTSGTWANGTYLAESQNAPSEPPEGFHGVLSQQQWKGLVDFSNAVKGPIITSFAASPGVRDASGNWQPDQAQHLLSYTKSIGGNIVAAEFINEPTLAVGGVPAGYDAAAYGRDFKAFHAFFRKAAPEVLILGPGSVGESDGKWGVAYNGYSMLDTTELMKAAGPGVDVFSYHHYGAVSKRCAPKAQTSEQAALSEEWLARTDQTLSFYQRQRDEFEPGKPIWMTEGADAACGGNPWASTFRDTFRYLDQLGRLAKQNVQIVAHNTLAASDYGLLDEDTFAPRPSYWGALLWSKFMGTTVLDSNIEIRQGLHVYAQCLKGTPGGVAVMAINNDEANSQTLSLPMASQRYTLASKDGLSSKAVELNGKTLSLGKDDQLPLISGEKKVAGNVELQPASITFLTVPDANNKACR